MIFMRQFFTNSDDSFKASYTLSIVQQTLDKIMNLGNIHCEKSLFVLASRQKIPALRTEIPAVDTRTICLLPIEFF